MNKEKSMWKISFELEETAITEEDTCKFQREVTYTIGQIASLIPARFKELRVVDYKVTRNGKEQPEAACLELKKRKK